MVTPSGFLRLGGGRQLRAATRSAAHSPLPLQQNTQNRQLQCSQTQLLQRPPLPRTIAFNEVFQYSTVSALMDGVASQGIPIARILEHGDHGIGTFRNIEGEMVVLDGQVFHIKGDGSVVHTKPHETAVAPFVSVTHFRPTVLRRGPVTGHAGLKCLLMGLFPKADNHFLIVRVDGVFKRIHLRTVAGQSKPREGLVDVCSRQTAETLEGVKGTIVGFRCPEFVNGVNVAGGHFHFISEDRKRGGHVLSVETAGDVDIAAAQMSKFYLELPAGDEEFNDAGLKQRPNTDIFAA